MNVKLGNSVGIEWNIDNGAWQAEVLSVLLHSFYLNGVPTRGDKWFTSRMQSGVHRPSYEHFMLRRWYCFVNPFFRKTSDYDGSGLFNVIRFKLNS